jgi:hypothetical protein
LERRKRPLILVYRANFKTLPARSRGLSGLMRLVFENETKKEQE